MDVQFNVGTLVRAITTGDVSQLAEQLAEDFKRSVTAVIDQFLGCDLSPAGTHRLEVELLHCLRGMGREIVQWLLANLEPELEKMPGTLKHQGKTHRRLAVKSMRTDIVTCFGKVSLLRGRYRRGRAGRTIFPAGWHCQNGFQSVPLVIPVRSWGGHFLRPSGAGECEQLRCCELLRQASKR